MMILLPFKLLKIRNDFEKAYRNQNDNLLNSEISKCQLYSEISKLREIYESDIISTIENSYKQGVISRAAS